MEIEKELEVYRRLYGKVVSKVFLTEEIYCTVVKRGKEFENMEVSNICYPSKFFEDEDGYVKVQATFKIGKTRWKKCFVDMSSKTKLLESLFKQGFSLINNDSDVTLAFINHFFDLYSVLTEQAPSRIIKQLGWQKNSRDFALGKEYYSYVKKDNKNTFELQECEVDSNLDSLVQELTTSGSEEIFKNQIEEFFKLDCPKYHVFYLCAISTPGLGLVKRNGTVINLQSNSPSIGKSLVQKISKLTYFNNEVLINGFTYNSMVEEIRKHNNFPVFLEEISRGIIESSQDVSRFIHTLTGGISKLRNSENGNNRKVNTFKTSLLTSSNPDIFTVIDSESTAELVRALQISITPKEADYIKKNNIQKKIGKIKDVLENNYGFGKTFIKQMLKSNYEETYNEVFDEISESFKEDSYRYIAFVLSNAITFAYLLESIGYKIDVEKIKETCFKIIEEEIELVNDKSLTGIKAIENIINNLPIQHYVKQNETAYPLKDDKQPDLFGKHKAMIVNSKELIIPKDTFDSIVCSDTKSKGKNIFNLSSKELILLLKNNGIICETKQKRYGKGRTTCIIISIPDVLV